MVLSEGAVTIKVTEVQLPRGANGVMPGNSSTFSSSDGLANSSGASLASLDNTAATEQPDADFPFGKVVATVLIGGTLGEDRVVDIAGGSLLHVSGLGRAGNW